MSTADSKPTRTGVNRDETPPFLIRTFIKQQTHHRLLDFDGPQLPVADELQLYTWPDATLKDVILTLRSITTPQNPNSSSGSSSDLSHPLAKYTIKLVFPDPTAKGRFQMKDLGAVFARDLADPKILDTDVKRDEVIEGRDENGDKMDEEPVEANDGNETTNDANGRGKEDRREKTLEELKVFPGDYLSIAVILPRSSTTAPSSQAPSGMSVANTIGRGGPPPVGSFGGRGAALAIRGVSAPTGQWRGGAPGSIGAGRGVPDRGYGGRGGGPAGRGRGEREDRGPRGPDRDARRDSDRGRFGRGGRAPARSRSRSERDRSRSRSPARNRRRSQSRSRD